MHLMMKPLSLGYLPLGALTVLFALLFSVTQAPCASETDPIAMKLVSQKHKTLVNELIEKHGFDIDFLMPLFKEVVIRPEILEKFERAPEKRLHYYEYRKLFLTEGVLARGHAYFESNRPLLEKIEAEYGVPKEIVVAILGIETRFGQPGIEPYRAWDAFNTIYAFYSPRAAFFKEELIAFLKLCQMEGLDPLSIRSSYAGAMGVPQFMPSSFLKYAVDYDGDKKRNLWSSNEDIYASVANYLKQSGWKKNGPLFFPDKVPENSDDVKKLVAGGIREVLSSASAIKLGIEMPMLVNPEAPVSFVAYRPTEEGQELFLSLFDNFRAITRYNISVNYALVVVELADILAKGNKVQDVPLELEEATPEIPVIKDGVLPVADPTPPAPS